MGRSLFRPDDSDDTIVPLKEIEDILEAELNLINYSEFSSTYSILEMDLSLPFPTPTNYSSFHEILADIEELRNEEKFQIKTYCSSTFDGWSCWDATAAGDTALAPCPYFVTGFDKTRFAFRRCLENGSWFRHPTTGFPWSNYTTCVDLDDLKIREIVNSLYITGYAISFTALMISLFIFLTFRSLRCTRIAIHVHLFISFAANDLMWLVWYKNVVGMTSVVQNNEGFCVSVLFCFANVDVHSAMKAMIRRLQRRAADNGTLTATQTREVV